MRGPGELENLIQLHPAGTRLVLKIRRGGKVFEQNVQLGGIQATAALGVGELRNPFRTEAAPEKDKEPEPGAKPEEKKE